MKDNNTEVISPSMCYAYAAIAEDAPFVMGAPNLCVDTPAMWEFSKQKNVPISGKDFKSGQTLMKTVLAPMFKTRMLGVNGWFSTNILGNRDGEVLDDPDNFKTKEVSKLSVIDTIFEPEKYPDLYGDVYHKVRINYYPPRKDNKEAWDNIDIFGWMGYPMEIKVNFLCRDSILAAPIALDLVLFSDLAMRAGMCGIQTWLSFFCKSPMHDFEHQPEHDLFTQWRMVKQTLRNMIGENEETLLSTCFYRHGLWLRFFSFCSRYGWGVAGFYHLDCTLFSASFHCCIVGDCRFGDCIYLCRHLGCQ